MSNHEVHLARYITIAADIADRIVRGEYLEGQKVFGRSTLAGKYNVSPETIRRALTLLQEVGIVQVAPGVGVVVKSISAAQKYLEDHDQRTALAGLHEKLHDLVKERDRLNSEISRLTEELMEHTLQLEARLYKIEEWKIVSNSYLAGKTIGDTRLIDQKVLAIQRRGEPDIIDPAPETTLEGGDILTIYGRMDPELRKSLVRV